MFTKKTVKAYRGGYIKGAVKMGDFDEAAAVIEDEINDLADETPSAQHVTDVQANADSGTLMVIFSKANNSESERIIEDNAEDFMVYVKDALEGLGVEVNRSKIMRLNGNTCILVFYSFPDEVYS